MAAAIIFLIVLIIVTVLKNEGSRLHIDFRGIGALDRTLGVSSYRRGRGVLVGRGGIPVLFLVVGPIRPSG